jgi:hypothetical protein
MPLREPFISYTIQHHSPMPAGDLHIQLTSQTLRVRLPLRNHMEMSWSRPAYVTWQKGLTGKRVMTPIIDITRLAQIAILSATLMGVFLYRISLRRKGRSHTRLTLSKSTGDDNDTRSRAERQ